MKERGYITQNGLTVLRYLNERMEAPSRSLGMAVLPPVGNELPHAQIASVGRSVAMHLRRQGLVTFLSDLRCWRITQAGRDALAAS